MKAYISIWFLLNGEFVDLCFGYELMAYCPSLEVLILDHIK